MWYTIDCFQLMSQFAHYQPQLIYLTVEHRPARNLQHETLQTTFDTFRKSQHLPGAQKCLLNELMNKYHECALGVTNAKHLLLNFIR